MTLSGKQYEYLVDLTQLPANARLAVFGTGGLGAIFFRRLRDERPDVEIVAFLDSFRMGRYQGRPMVSPDEFFQKPHKIDCYVIASHLWADEISAILSHYQASPQFVSMLVEEQKYAYLYLDEGSYRSEELSISALLATEEYRSLWQRVMHCLRSRDSSPMIDWYVDHRETPYLHQVSLTEGAVVIEGGVFDGSNTFEFAKLAGASGRVYGFDPWGDRFIVKRQRKELLPENVEIIPKALWSHSRLLQLHDKGAGTTVSTQDPAGATVVGISIDEFVEQREITRIDLVKMDIEGAESEALKGALKAIARFRPQLAISIYHSKQDLFGIPLFLARELAGYCFHLYGYSPSLGDLVFFAIPQERQA